MKESNFLGLALSGGGYRAAAYHIGSLRALKKLKLLDRINVLSTNSGGAITGAYYSLNHKDFDKFEMSLTEGLQKSVIWELILNPRFYIPLIILLLVIAFAIILLFTDFAWVNLVLIPTLILIFIHSQFEIFPISRIIEKIYDDFFFKKTKLSDLTNDFKTIINSTNLSTSRVFHFSKDKMNDSKYEYPIEGESINFKHIHFPIARAVMASSSVPFIFTPVKISKEFFEKPNDYNRVNPILVDGGIYDNQGMHKLTFEGSSSFCKNVIVSDAGIELPFKRNYKNVFTLLIRVSSVFMSRIKNFQMMNNLYRSPKPTDSNVAYQSLSFNLEQSIIEFMRMLKNNHLSCEVIEAHKIPQQHIREEEWEEIEALISENVDLKKLISKGCSPSELDLARAVGTNLVPLSKDETNALIKHAEVLTEIQIKLFLPHLLERRI